MSNISEYDPVECLREEVKRFKATNQFTPMLLTNFYAQAAVVLDQYDQLKSQLAECQRQLAETEKLNNELSARFTTTADAHAYFAAQKAHDAALVAQLAKEVAAAIQEHRFNGETDVRSVAASARMVFDARLRTIGKL